ncbi:hypothetical protein [Sphingobacterium sp. E70]|uniref:hypothetical protein n=1 Tax=Sphingobacterium sp. E70 TaxID=2853439 RepID=UPI00279615F2|nr:hypothetical protein [Sphingobacterium sp. E70]
MIFELDSKKLDFPHPSYAEKDGLLAIGGDLSAERLLLAYSNGIFLGLVMIAQYYGMHLIHASSFIHPR